MFRLNIKIAWRNLWKNKTYTLITLSGLTIAMASCMLIFIFIRYQTSFDKGYKNGDRIFRFVTDWNYGSHTEHTQGIPIPLITAARNDISEFENVSAVLKTSALLRINDANGRERSKSDESIYYIEPSFFDIFQITWLYGGAKDALSAPNQVVLSESTALRLFGRSSGAIGKQIICKEKILVVAGIFKDMPENSSLPLHIVVSYQTFNSSKYVNWDSVSSEWECYVKLRKRVQPSEIRKSLAVFNQKYYGKRNIPGHQTNGLQALKDIHFDERYGNFANRTIRKNELYGLAMIGAFLLLTACINFINLSTAQAINRAKEIGIRKVMGSGRKQLVFQILTETFAISLIASLLACVGTELLLPSLQNLFHGQIIFSLVQDPVIYVFIALLPFAISLLAGFYPAVFISGFSPVSAIKNKVTVDSGSLGLRRLLVLVQFTITVILVLATLVIARQMKYIREKPLGFSSTAIAMMNMPTDSASRLKLKTFKARVAAIPGVKLASLCSGAPLSSDVTTSTFNYNYHKNTDFEVRVSTADENYLRLFKIKMLAGTNYKKSDTAAGCLVNETFLRKLNIGHPQEILGKCLKLINANGKNVPVIGVFQDYNDQSLQQHISPMVLYPDHDNYNKIAIAFDHQGLLSSTKMVQTLWRNTFPASTPGLTFVSEEIQRYYDGERITGILFQLSAGVIIFISFTGLFGLISFVAVQRRRELAIRKVLGATTANLLNMLNESFLWLVVMANLIAFPLAYLFASEWLSTFAYRTTLTIWPFIITFLTSVLLTLLTVSYRSYQAAAGSLTEILKYD